MGERSNPSEQIIEKLGPLLERPDLRIVILFGSQAVGEARRDSDIDLALLGDHPLDLVSLTTEVIRLLKQSRVDLVDLRRASPLLMMEIVRNGTLLYERTPGGYLEFCSLAVRRYIDTKKLRDARGTAIKRFLEQRGLP